MKPEKLNIFFISSWLPTIDKPHLGNFVVKHANSISSFCNVFLVSIIFQNVLTHKKTIIQNNNGLYNIEIQLTNKCYLYKLFPWLKHLRLIYEYLKVFKYICRSYSKIDIVHTNVIIPLSIIAFCIKLFYKVPYIVSEHWTGYLDRDPHKLNVFKKLLIKLVLSKSSYITAVSDELKYALKAIYPKSKIEVIPNVVDDIFFNFPLKYLHGEKFRFTHISTLDNKQKNVTGIIDSFIEVHKEYNNTILTIVGEKRNKFIENYVSKKTTFKNIIFFKYNLKSEEIADLLSNSNALVMFSNYESFSIVIAEALALGVPVIASKCGGLADNLSENYGFFIQPNDKIELIRAMKQMIVRYETIDKSQLRNFAKQFSFNRVGEQFFHIYNKTIVEK